MQTTRGAKKWLGLGVLACAACCAVPLTVIFGVGSATAMTGALFAGVETETILCLAVLGALLVGIGYVALRSRRRKVERQTCSTSCKPDAGCCGGKSNVLEN